MMIMTAAGAGMDLSQAYLARQKLSEVATLACQYASRPQVIQTSVPSYSGSNGGATYTSQVNSFITKTLASQNFQLTQTNSSPFTYTQNGSASVSLSATVPTAFMKIASVQTIPISITTNCYGSASTILQRTPDGSNPYLIKESFEANGPSGWTSYAVNGSVSYPSTPSAWTGATTYTGSNGTKWSATGYCLEQDQVGNISSTAVDGNYMVELDCSGNSSITTKIYLAAGNYELRYFYKSRVAYLNYAPAYICGSAASDVSWATDTSSSGGPVANVAKTNQINVYLDLATGSAPPTHTTIDGTQSLAGSNLIDVCVYAQDWSERSVKVNITTAGFYFLSFAADGYSDTYGGILDYIRLCPNTCPGTVQDNFPSAWLVANKILFADTFETMTVVNNYGLYSNVNMSTSYGSTGTSASGWPSATATGWRIDPVNQANGIYYQPIQGAMSIELDADANVGGVANSNRTISRPLLLMPGYYQMSYKYRANATFTTLGSTIYCGATPTAALLSSLSGTATADRSYSGSGTATMAKDTNMIGVFMSHDQLASNANAASYGSAATFSNPNGTTTSSPTVPNDNISLTNYDSTQVNPLLDICGYANGWQSRTATIKIQKPAYYWLTMAALGTADNVGGSIDDVKLWALGSLYMSSPPSGAVRIPVPNPQPGSTVSFTGFSITANPLTP
jgi:hypothetical protein